MSGGEGGGVAPPCFVGSEHPLDHEPQDRAVKIYKYLTWL
jgi:hypothetical protein